MLHLIGPCILCLSLNVADEINKNYAEIAYKCNARVIKGHYKDKEIIGAYVDLGTKYQFYSKHLEHTDIVLNILRYDDPADGLEACKLYFHHCRKVIVPCDRAWKTKRIGS